MKGLLLHSGRAVWIIKYGDRIVRICGEFLGFTTLQLDRILNCVLHDLISVIQVFGNQELPPSLRNQSLSCYNPKERPFV